VNGNNRSKENTCDIWRLQARGCGVNDRGRKRVLGFGIIKILRGNFDLSNYNFLFLCFNF